MPDDPIEGRVIATRRAVVDLVRTATLGSYGVVDFAGGPLERLLAGLQGRPPGLRVSLAGGTIAIDLRLRISHRLPIAEVARQVDSAVRYAVRRGLGREVDRLTIRVAGLELPAPAPAPEPAPAEAPGPAAPAATSEGLELDADGATGPA